MLFRLSCLLFGVYRLLLLFVVRCFVVVVVLLLFLFFVVVCEMVFVVHCMLFFCLLGVACFDWCCFIDVVWYSVFLV